ncbi:unnamed protein product [Fusarium venenatum]|uniref:Protein kinase domain-containing protein n=1 Tax=Fusarium venenatum TaxID=56646 RepID=A0A2L2TKV9_9HYPO|nr:uncharacterized protein FVRRES_13768 [Fusarium venenatum]CEI41842.1 unnamed protein product [Fusarium venenatum]
MTPDTFDSQPSMTMEEVYVGEIKTDVKVLAELPDSGVDDHPKRPHAINDLQENPKARFKELLNRALHFDKRNDEKHFLPNGDLKAICNESAVRDQLIAFEYNEYDAESYATYVGEKLAQEIFAALVLINQVKFLPDFINAGITDDNLPFTFNKRHTQLWYRQPDRLILVEFLKYPRDAEMMREFYTKQWWVHVPFLDWDKENRKALNFRYNLGTVIPWTYIGQQDTSGGFGVVEKVKMHQDHHSFIGRQTQYETFALKSMIRTCHDDDYKFFQQEISAFHKMRPGPHLVELCATLEIAPSDNFMLLFPWAEGGSLEDLMSKPKTYFLKAYYLTDNEFARWIAIQCWGLIQALGTIHDTRIKHSNTSQDGNQISQCKDFGIHGDIKPANILHFSQETAHCRVGNLKIADFGLITFHRRGSRTMMNRNSAYAASQTYRSPEHDIGYFMSKKVDVWALGCVFSELMTWVILDGNARQEYQQERKRELSFSGATEDTAQWNEDNFFLKHIEKTTTPRRKGRRRRPKVRSKRLRPRNPKIKSDASHVVESRQSISKSPKHFQEVPKLKVSVKNVRYPSDNHF